MALKLKKVLRIRWLVLVLIIAVIIAIYLIFSSKPVELPSDFLVARENAALVSGKIVELTSATNERIKAANLEDLNGNAAQAYNLIQEARTNNAEAQTQAFELSRHLQRLAESLADLPSLKSQRLAYETVAIELSLVSEFITYTQNLNEFLNNLVIAIQTDTPSNRRAVYEKLVAVNKSAVKINNLNREFLAKIEEFDRSL